MKLQNRILYKFLIEKILSKDTKKNYFVLINKELFCHLTDINMPRNVIILFFSREKKKYYCITTSEKNTEIKKKFNRKLHLGKVKFIFKNDKNLSFSVTQNILDELEYNNSIWINLLNE